MNLVERLKQENVNMGGIGVNFQRTCRVPQGKVNGLPAGLGSFPVYKVSDFSTGAPGNWHKEGFFMPMYRQEAMWISFRRNYSDPKALVIGAGNINAISGKPFDPSKNKLCGNRGNTKEGVEVKLEGEQNYIVTPPQPWLDGWKAKDGKVYQFVAAELGSGETVEGQITGEETVGGIQFIVYGAKDGKKLISQTTPNTHQIGGSWTSGYGGTLESATTFGGPLYNLKSSGIRCCSAGSFSAAPREMGLGKGGEISQKIYPDPYGIEVWNSSPESVSMLYLVSSEDFRQITGQSAPSTPVTFEEYQRQGLPWFELGDKVYQDTPGSGIVDNLKPVGNGENQKYDPFAILTPKK
jgi:hypothetical protein